MQRGSEHWQGLLTPLLPTHALTAAPGNAEAAAGCCARLLRQRPAQFANEVVDLGWILHAPILLFLHAMGRQVAHGAVRNIVVQRVCEVELDLMERDPQERDTALGLLKTNPAPQL